MIWKNGSKKVPALGHIIPEPIFHWKYLIGSEESDSHEYVSSNEIRLIK
jgi:hypothetical protein